MFNLWVTLDAIVGAYLNAYPNWYYRKTETKYFYVPALKYHINVYASNPFACSLDVYQGIKFRYTWLWKIEHLYRVVVRAQHV